MKGWRSKKHLALLRLVIGVAFFLVALPEAAMPHEAGVSVTTDNCADGPYTNHHCPVNGSEPIHHCPQCCVFSHSFTNESYQGISFIVPDNCGPAVVIEGITLSNLLPDTIFHPPKNL